jgi:TrmH family RNA methyltransferase
LLRRAHRREEGAFLLEGNRALADAIDAGAPIQELFVAAELAHEPIVEQARGSGAQVHVVGWSIVKAISDSVTPQGMVGVVVSPLRELTDLELRSGTLVVLAGVSDPGNVGTLIRTAAAADADGVILTEGSADPLNPKTARSSAAALFAVTLVADVTIPAALERAKALGYSLLGTDSAASGSIYDVDLSGPIAVVLGNESWGLGGDEKRLLDQVLTIPMPGSIESLNVATAGSIVIFESLRQRRETQASTVSSATKEA